MTNEFSKNSKDINKQFQKKKNISVNSKHIKGLTFKKK